MWSCLVFIAGPGFYTVSLLLRMGDFGSSDHLVLELFVVGCSGSRDGLNPTPLPIHLHSSPLPQCWNHEYPSMQRGSLPVCLWQAHDMGHGPIVFCCPNKPRREKNTDILNECICVCIEIWTFHAHRVSRFMHLRV